MPVENKYTDANTVAGKLAIPLTGQGASPVIMSGTIAVAAADDDGSVYRVFSGVPSRLIPVSMCIHNTAVTNGTDYDVGLYKTNGGAVVDRDVLADGISMATARGIETVNNAGLTSLNIANGLQSLAALSAQTDPDASYDIALTANTVGTAAGTIRVTAVFVTI